MNLCEKSGVSASVYKGFCLFKKDGDFGPMKKLFVLQETDRFLTEWTEFTEWEERRAG